MKNSKVERNEVSYTESEIRDNVLLVLSQSPNGSQTTTELIDKLTILMNPVGKDSEIIEGRSDTYFSQKVRNVVSHRNQGTGLVYQGLVTYDQNEERLTITNLGVRSVP